MYQNARCNNKKKSLTYYLAVILPPQS